ncbi:MAG: VCBS repeat-containing protein [Gemmatimonadota bacterium]
MADPLIRFDHCVVDDDNPRDPHCKGAGDLDGDGLPDLVVAGAREGGLYWYRYPAWSRHCIAPGSFTTDLAVADVDGDGCLDVVVPCNGVLTLYRNPRSRGGSPATDPWEAVPIGPEGAHDVEVADLDNDGRLDLVTRYQSGFGHRRGNAIHLWQQQTPHSWRHRAFACPHGEGLALADVNGDGRVDVIIGGRWYENPGDPMAGEWREHLYVTESDFEAHWTNGDVAIAAADLNGDGRVEIALSPAEGGGRLSWFEPPGEPSGRWTEHVLEPELDHAHSLAIGDLDGDGRPDLVTAKMHQASAPQEVFAWLNRGAGRPWERCTIATTGSHNICLVDVGGTGQLDVFGANWNDASSTGGRVELWLNRGRGEAS